MKGRNEWTTPAVRNSHQTQASNKNVGKRTVISELFWQTTIILVGSGESTQGEKRAVHYSYVCTAVVIDPDGSIALDYRYYSVLQ